MNKQKLLWSLLLAVFCVGNSATAAGQGPTYNFNFLDEEKSSAKEEFQRQPSRKEDLRQVFENEREKFRSFFAEERQQLAKERGQGKKDNPLEKQNVQEKLAQPLPTNFYSADGDFFYLAINEEGEHYDLSGFSAGFTWPLFSQMLMSFHLYMVKKNKNFSSGNKLKSRGANLELTKNWALTNSKGFLFELLFSGRGSVIKQTVDCVGSLPTCQANMENNIYYWKNHSFSEASYLTFLEGLIGLSARNSYIRTYLKAGILKGKRYQGLSSQGDRDVNGLTGIVGVSLTI